MVVWVNTEWVITDVHKYVSPRNRAHTELIDLSVSPEGLTVVRKRTVP